MAFLIYVFCTVFIQLTYGQTSFLSGQRAINAQANALSNAWPLTPNAQSSRSLGAVPATNSLASQTAITANGLANTNLAGVNTITTSGNIPRVNPNPNNVNTPSQSLASSLASANAATVSNFANIANSNPGANKIQTFIIANPILPGKIASSVPSSKYPFSPFAQSYGNYANQNFASAKPAMATWPNAATGNYYSQSMNGPGNQQYGINIQADGLEIAGSVTVTGKMPIYGTVNLNGRVPTEGTGKVNYAC